MKTFRLHTLLITALALCFSASLLTSCDDDDESGSGEVVLLSMGPSGVKHGEKIKFIGANLDKVETIVLPPGIEIPSSGFASQSSDLIELVVPGPAEPGIVTLKFSQGEIQSKSILSFEAPLVTITGFPEEAKPGTDITITGENLNWIDEVVFTAGVVVPKSEFVSRSADEVVITVPMDAQTGILTFNIGGTEPWELETEEVIVVTLPVVEELSPASIRHEQNLTLIGTDLDLVSQITFSGGAVIVSEGFESQSETEIVVTVPSTTTTGKLTLTVPSGITVETSALTILLPAVTSFSPSDADAHVPGASLVINGTDLDLVGAIRFPNVSTAVTEFTKSESQIEVVIPEGAQGGTMVFVTIHGVVVPVSVPFGPQLVLVATIYDDAVKSPFGAGGGWGGVVTETNSSEQVRVGSKSVKVTFANSWGGGCQFGTWGNSPLPVGGNTVFQFSIYGGPGTAGKQMNVNVGGTQAQVTIEEGKWKDVQILLSSVGSPTSINEVWFQDRGFAGVVYIDHIGLK
jgi:hypothetical protein